MSKRLIVCLFGVFLFSKILVQAEEEKKILIINENKLKVWDSPDTNLSPKHILLKYDIVSIQKELYYNQKKWFFIKYVNQANSTTKDTLGYIEISPDLKDIVPINLLRNAKVYLAFNPATIITVDLMETKWEYTGEIYEQKVSSSNIEAEIVKEWYQIKCHLFVPCTEEGYILQNKKFYKAFNLNDAHRRVKAVKTHPNWKKIFKEKILSGYITEQMTSDMVRASWGEPKKIQKGTPQIWWYGTESKPIKVKFIKHRVVEWEK
ncbi:MAG: hypothetical protein ACTSUG_06865 [Candidatus Helarchaeota archaeon]